MLIVRTSLYAWLEEYWGTLGVFLHVFLAFSCLCYFNWLLLLISVGHIACDIQCSCGCLSLKSSSRWTIPIRENWLFHSRLWQHTRQGNKLSVSCDHLRIKSLFDFQLIFNCTVKLREDTSKWFVCIVINDCYLFWCLVSLFWIKFIGFYYCYCDVLVPYLCRCSFVHHLATVFLSYEIEIRSNYCDCRLVCTLSVGLIYSSYCNVHSDRHSRWQI